MKQSPRVDAVATIYLYKALLKAKMDALRNYRKDLAIWPSVSANLAHILHPPGLAQNAFYC